jgi:hypothetical protein
MKKLIPFGSVALLAVAATFSQTGCNKTPENTAQNTAPAAGDAANGNLATPDSSQAQPAPQQYQQQPAPQQRYQQPAAPPPQGNQQYPAESGYSEQSGYDQSSGSYAYAADDSYGQPVYAPQPPPPLPEYQQPPCPGDDYIWTPGTWAYVDTGYYWTPGAWVLAPFIGALWTPPYWGFFGGRYRYYSGYWGPHIGFYGGINYGFGYTGRGFYGGYWSGNAFTYNRSVTNVNVTVIHNVYTSNVPSFTSTRVSYNGGNGGVPVRPIPAELAVQNERRLPPVPAQIAQIRQAATNRAQFAAVNHGAPPTVVLARPIATSYRAPAPTSQAVQMRPLPQAAPRAAAPVAPQARPNTTQAFRPTAPAPAPNRPAPMQAAARPAPSAAPMQHAAPPPRPAPALAQHAAPPPRPEPAQQHAAPAPRPAPVEHAAPPPRPAPVELAAPPPRPAPAQHAAPPPRPAPAQHAAPPPRPAPAQHAAPPPRPAPAAHPAPPKEEHK